MEAPNNSGLKVSYGTLSQTVNGLKKDGYTLDFNMHQDCLICGSEGISLSPEDFVIDAAYRFEGESNPDDEAIVYAISSPNFEAKGVLVNGYGIYAEEAASALVEKLSKASVRV